MTLRIIGSLTLIAIVVIIYTSSTALGDAQMKLSAKLEAALDYLTSDEFADNSNISNINTSVFRDTLMDICSENKLYEWTWQQIIPYFPKDLLEEALEIYTDLVEAAE